MHEGLVTFMLSCILTAFAGKQEEEMSNAVPVCRESTLQRDSEALTLFRLSPLEFSLASIPLNLTEWPSDTTTHLYAQTVNLPFWRPGQHY